MLIFYGQLDKLHEKMTSSGEYCVLSINLYGFDPKIWNSGPMSANPLRDSIDALSRGRYTTKYSNKRRNNAGTSNLSTQRRWKFCRTKLCVRVSNANLKMRVILSNQNPQKLRIL